MKPYSVVIIPAVGAYLMDANGNLVATFENTRTATQYREAHASPSPPLPPPNAPPSVVAPTKRVRRRSAGRKHLPWPPVGSRRRLVVDALAAFSEPSACAVQLQPLCGGTLSAVSAALSQVYLGTHLLECEYRPSLKGGRRAYYRLTEEGRAAQARAIKAGK